MGRSSSILECKYFSFKSISIIFIIVEVAPYWNVNLQVRNLSDSVFSVEVAPYWNVNMGNFYSVSEDGT